MIANLAILGVVYSLFGEKIGNYFVERLLEKHKYELSKEYFKFEKVHVEKFSFLKEVYSSLHEIEKKLPRYDITDHSRSDKLEEDFYTLKDLIDKNDILIPENVEDNLRAFIQKSIEILAYQKQATIQHSMQDFSEASKSALCAYKSIHENLPILKLELKKIVRNEFGV